MNYLLDLFADFNEIFSAESFDEIDFREYDMVVNYDLDFIDNCS